MTVGANSYGTAADVAALSDVYTISNAYTTATIPTLAQVEGWIDQVSAIMNASLAAQGFTIPVSQADSVLAIKSYVVQAVTDLAHAANSAGRFFSDRALQAGTSPMAAVRKEILDWVLTFADGLEALGAARSGDTATGDIGFKGTDANGNETFPIFQREAFGNVFDDWSAD